MKDRLLRLREKNPRLYEMGAYLFFGALTTLVNWAAYLLLTSLLSLPLKEQGSPPYLLAANVSQAAAWILSVLFAYLTNRRFVFRSKTGTGGQLRELWLFVSSRALGYALFDLLLFSAFLLFMGDRPAKLIMNGFVIVFNYLASRYVIFRRSRAEGTKDREEEQV